MLSVLSGSASKSSRVKNSKYVSKDLLSSTHIYSGKNCFRTGALKKKSLSTEDSKEVRFKPGVLRYIFVATSRNLLSMKLSH